MGLADQAQQADPPGAVEASRKAGRTAARKDKRKTAKPAKTAREDGRLKSTLLLPVDVDFMLGTIAASQNLDRSQFAAYLLDQGLRKYDMYAALQPFVPKIQAKSSDQATP
jgi:hypothetical protein